MKLRVGVGLWGGSSTFLFCRMVFKVICKYPEPRTTRSHLQFDYLTNDMPQ